jgi:hypothetical protein
MYEYKAGEGGGCNKDFFFMGCAYKKYDVVIRQGLEGLCNVAAVHILGVSEQQAEHIK